MNKITLLTVAIVLLFLLNAVTLYLLFSNGHRRPGGMEGGRPDINFISHQLNFDEKQQSEFKILRDQQKTELENLRNNDKSLRDVLVSSLKSGVTDSLKIDSITSLLAASRKIMELTFYKHFSQIRSICRPDQLELFNKTLDEMMKRRMPGPGPKEGRP
jgi:periplasmic protein CpxP/Spy